MKTTRWIVGGALVAGLVGAVVYGTHRGCAPAPAEPPAVIAPAAPPGLADGWVRRFAPEPDPAARGLYRRAIDLARAGDAAASAAVVEQLRAQYPDTRFGARVAREGDPRAAVALLGAAAAIAVTLAADPDRAPRPPKPPANPALRLPPPGRPLPGSR